VTDYINQLLAQYQPITQYPWLDTLMLAGIMLVISLIIDKINRRILINLLRKFLGKTAPKMLVLLRNHRALDKISAIVPLVVISMLSPIAFANYPAIGELVNTLCKVAIMIKMATFVFALLDVMLDMGRARGINKNLPIKSINQLIKLFIFLVVTVLSISALLGKSPIYFLSGLGAMTAVILLIFKDTILGFVAGVQLAANNMVTRGDWISMPKYGADGEVLEVALTTVQVQNWDKTITMIPAYALISDSFKNWRGMEQAGGRRIKRSVRLDVNSIRFLDQPLIDQLCKIDSINDYLESKQQELSEQNKLLDVDLNITANGRKLTNVGTFRTYLEFYLKNHHNVHQNMTLIVRQLPADEHGLPIELYFFCNDIRWGNYEAIQADIFDHIYAVLPEFKLRPFQSPTGGDFNKMVD